MALALLRLIKPPGRIEGLLAWLDGRDLMTLSDEEMRAGLGWRGSRWCRRAR